MIRLPSLLRSTHLLSTAKGTGLTTSHVERSETLNYRSFWTTGPRISENYLSSHQTFPQACVIQQRSFGNRPPITPPPTTYQGLKIEEVEPGIKKLSLNSPPVNSLTTSLMVEIEQALRLIEDDGQTRGILLCSSVPQIFTAGLDLKTMYQPEEKAAKKFWNSLHEVFYRLYLTPLATVAVVEGHAPAGGCFLSMCCDGRVMKKGKGRIGLNESQIGISAPWWFAMLMKDVIPARLAERHLQLGTLFTPEEAFAIGLVDEIADNAFDSGLKMLKQFLAVPDRARSECKHILRKSAVQVVQGGREHDVQVFWHFVNSPIVQDSLKNYLSSLKSGAASSNPPPAAPKSEPSSSSQ